MLEKIRAELPLKPVEANYRGEVAARYRDCEGGGEIGFISSVSQPFCGDCTRLRLSSDGSMYTCLFAAKGIDLRTMMREGRSDDCVSQAIAGIWKSRGDRYSEERAFSEGTVEKVEMSRIGG